MSCEYIMVKAVSAAAVCHNLQNGGGCRFLVEAAGGGRGCRLEVEVNGPCIDVVVVLVCLERLCVKI